jgi:hypothetical protein
MTKIKIGDVVKVDNPGKTYDTYDKIFVEAGFKNQDENPSFDTNETGRVFWIGEHPDQRCLLIAIRHADGREVLMNKEGVSIVSVSDEYTVDKQFIIDAHKAACSEWKAKLEAKYPDVFNKEFNISALTTLSNNKLFTNEQAEAAGFVDDRFMEVRTSSCSDGFGGKAFWLDSRYGWELKKVESGGMLLIPTVNKIYY